MKTNRLEFLNILTAVFPGTSKKEMTEQSDCFVFSDDKITAFNDEIFASIGFISGWKFAVVADDLIKLISKFPEDEIGMEIKGNQLYVTGKKKRAGLTIQNEIKLPVGELPNPEKLDKAPENIINNFTMAARVCDPSSENYKVTHIYVTENQILSTDRYRFMRIKGETGINRLLIPASALLSISSIKAKNISVKNGWLFIKSENECLYAVNCSDEEYLEESKIDEIMNISNSSTVRFPKEMKEAVDRAFVMAKDDVNKLANVSLTKKYVIIKTQKSTGWYEEKQPLKYKGDDLEIKIGLPLFKDLLERTLKAKVCETKIKMEKDGLEYVTALGE